MATLPLQLPPGLERNGTPYESPNRFWDTNLVRWQSGNMHPVGGWNKLTATPLTGAVRKIHVYRDNQDQRHALIGTDDKLYIDFGGGYTDVTPSAFTTLTSVGLGGGYGTGLYGAETYGTERSTPDPAFSPFAYWTFDNWGEDVVLTANSDGRIFYYSTAAATTSAAVVTTAPIGNNAVAVSAERHVLAIAQTGGSGSKYRVAWSSREDYTDWDFTSLTNTAGFEDLDAHSPLLKAIQVREGHLIFGRSDIYLMQYVGLPYVYGFTRISDTAMMHPDCIAVWNGKAAWLTNKGFQIYDSGAVTALDCPLTHDIFDELDPNYGRIRVHGCLNAVFPEIWWFYPTAGNTEANRYVMWNYAEQWWAWGMLSRSAMSPAQVYKFPYMGTADGNMYEHENGLTDSGYPRFQTIFVETGALEPSQDGSIVDITSIRAATINKNLSITAFSQYTPDGDETTFGPYVPRTDGYTDTRISARDMRLRFNPTADVHWGIGKVFLEVSKSSGARR